jgi:DNA-binding PadR family transcriptional regulator
MFWHVVLGLMRDGTRRHGYELRAMYHRRSGMQLGTGNFYRELMRLTTEGFLRQATNPPDADTRRIPYEITERGRDAFDGWLLAERREQDDLFEWILFLELVPRDIRDRILARRLEDCWIRNKILARAREDSPAGAATVAYDPRFASITRQMKQVAAEIEFLEELREQIQRWDSAVTASVPAPSSTPQQAATRPTTRPTRRGLVTQ